MCSSCRLRSGCKLLAEALRKVHYPVIQSTRFDVKPAELIKAAKELQFEGRDRQA
jgi:hypothetical protein